ncbi:hypothetical protein SADUNF_Sadunf06G0165000 [Salix dunnii]|uniref:30S ribosomal protein S4, chloroplastic n=1 Tax=Salix dunnii TaxID=1413687 RepID=A0A835MXF9_9ROSI|nr:hypothetical protein SADUNF_Sadunf06G0165000 [Salix dunnii]
MVHVSFYRNYGKTFKKPRRPYEKERLDAELKLVGEYGLRAKRELWRVQYALSRIRNAARMLLTLDEKNPRRIFEGEALLRRMNRYGLLEESQNKLDYVLALTVENFLERRLQTLVFKAGMAKSIHHARVLIKQRHIRVGRQVVNIPSFMVRVDSQKHIDFSLTSPFGGGRPGRVKRKNQKAASKKAADGKTFKKPRRPYEKERLDAELKLVGEYGLRAKRELWRVQYALSRIRNAARMLLTLDEKNPRRIFEGEALLRRMNRYGLLEESQNKLDYVLALTVENFLERRLQTLVFKAGMAKSIHHARVLIKQRHIRVGRQVVNIPSFMVRVDSQKHIDFSLTSPFGGGRPGRVKRKNQKAASKKAADGKTFKKPRRPYEKERLDAELKLVGEYGLRAKRELWRVQYALSRIRNAARMLLTLDEKNPRRIFEGEALLRRMNRYGLLEESQNKLDYVLALTVENFLERRLQTLVFKAGMAKSIHHARVLIKQRHIRVGRQVVNIPSFMVRVDSQKHIDFSLTSPFGGGRPGRVKRKNQKAASKKAAGGDGDDEDEE